MGSKNSVFNNIFDTKKEEIEPVHDDELHQNSTISSMKNRTRPRSRTNVLSNLTENGETEKKQDGQYIDDLDPRICQIWHRQSRYYNLLSENECGDLISDFRGHIGQKIPIVIREVSNEFKKNDSEVRYEVIAGSRRLWSALYVVKQLNSQFRLKAILKSLDDKQAAIECEKENDREELSAFERGMYYYRLLDQSVFDNQRQLAESLNIPKSSLQELLEFGKMDKRVVDIFTDPREIKRSWGKSINQLFSNATSREAILKKIDDIRQSECTYTSQKIFNCLQKAGKLSIDVPSSAKFEALNKEVTDPKTKRVAIKMERTRTNKIRINIDNKITMSKSEILKNMENFLNDCRKE